MVFDYKIDEKIDFYTVRHVLKDHFKLSNKLIMKLKRHNLIFLNRSICNLDSTVNYGDIVSFSLDYSEDNSNIIPTEMNLDIVFEDESLVVINKPPFMAIHPTSYHFNDTLSNGLKYYYDSIGLNKKIRPVNRLDRNTSGLVVFAKNEYVQELLIRQMINKTFVKKYLGIIEGFLEKKSGNISLPISRKEDSIIERKIDVNGLNSLTRYKVIKEYQNYSLLEFRLETGRTHQIRVHMQYLGHPLIGDSLYGNKSTFIDRQALHCYYLSFIHPVSYNPIVFKIDLPTDMNSLVYN